MNKLSGFSLLEILVALLIISLITLLSSDMLSNLSQWKSLSHAAQDRLKVELLFKTLRADISAATKKPTGQKRIYLTENKNGSVEILLSKPVISPSSGGIKVVDVVWKFTDKTVLRNLDNSKAPLKVDLLSGAYDVKKIDNNIFYFTLQTRNYGLTQILDVR